MQTAAPMFGSPILLRFGASAPSTPRITRTDSTIYMPQQMRFVSVAPPKPTTKAGVPPKPGFTSCAARFDGRWGSANGGPGPRIVFQAGKASVDDGITPQTMECWVNGDQLILRLVNDPLNGGSDITFDINKDGTIESTYFGQLKKR